MNLNQLKIFYYAAKNANLSVAAEKLFITQPAVTKGIQRLQEQYELKFIDFLPTAIAFHLRPQAQTLILQPRAGLDILTAKEAGSQKITAVEPNPLIIESAESVYKDPQVEVVIDSERSYMRGTNQKFDIIILSLVSSYHPIRSGAYSLSENYRCFYPVLHVFTGGVANLVFYRFLYRVLEFLETFGEMAHNIYAVFRSFLEKFSPKK